jgi:hypothetical protein
MVTPESGGNEGETASDRILDSRLFSSRPSVRITPLREHVFGFDPFIMLAQIREHSTQPRLRAS